MCILCEYRCTLVALVRFLPGVHELMTFQDRSQRELCSTLLTLEGLFTCMGALVSLQPALPWKYFSTLPTIKILLFLRASLLNRHLPSFLRYDLLRHLSDQLAGVRLCLHVVLDVHFTILAIHLNQTLPELETRVNILDIIHDSLLLHLQSSAGQLSLPVEGDPPLSFR